MPSSVVNLPHRITLVPSSKLEGKIRRQARDHPGLPTDLGRIVADLNTRPDGVPMTFSEPRAGAESWSLLVYARTYVLRLFLTQYRDAYIIASVNPLRIYDHHRLAPGYLRVRPAQWHLVYDFRQIPPGSNAHWDHLLGEWRRLSDESAVTRGAPPVTATQAAFLDMVDRMIDTTEKIATEETRSTPPFSYRSVSSTTERRHGRHATYVFELVPGRQPGEGDFVQIRGEPEQRGQITRVVGSSVTVRFDKPVDWGRIPRPGELERTPNSVVYDKQREAVALLRSRRAQNPDLLSVIVDHEVRPIQPSASTPAEVLDDDQLSAYRRALTVPDMLLVLGPPGTGKTRTISQIARTCTLERGERVLVTSHSNRAVDNVLAKLPSDIEAIRVGHEGSVTEEGLPYLLERRVTELRERILAATRRSMVAYGDLDVAVQWVGEFDERVGHLEAAIAGCTRGESELAQARRAAGGPFQLQVDRLTDEVARLARRLLRNEQLARLLTRCRAWVDVRAGVPVAGFLLTLLIPVLVWGMETLQRRGGRLHNAEKRRADELGDAERELEAVFRADPAVRAAGDRIAEATRRRTKSRADAVVAAHALRAVVSAVDTPPAVRHADDVAPEVTEQDLSRLRSWFRRELPLIVGRKGVLTDWHAEVSVATDQLHTDLVRYADVIAATSIGAASRPELSDIEFELAIVDEAGQIGVADALVPLVRARRGVLVGDHKQLPPFLDTEVEAWGKSVGDPIVRELLAKSALEILVEELPDTHIVPLTWQRRMPETIADFVSASFYDEKLHTGVEREHRDPLFRAPFAFVDTSKLPEERRRERSGRAREAWGQSGYVNPVEADLLTELAVFYHRRGADWAVIVPYRAQLAKISADIAPRIGDTHLTRLNVGTVDSFQGGERDVILYGFTRSNPKGDVGFLKELRRLNVAFSRAREQLVLIGDMSTLADARNRDFRELARSLRAYLADRGEIRHYQEIEARLAGYTTRTDTRTENA